MNHQTNPYRTPSNPLMEALMRWVSGTGRVSRFAIDRDM